MTAAVTDQPFRTHAPGFDAVLGDAPRLEWLTEVDAHEGPVYAADEDALYFTTLPRPGVDRSPSVQIKRLALDQPGDVSVVVVAEANGANGMACDLDGALVVCE